VADTLDPHRRRCVKRQIWNDWTIIQSLQTTRAKNADDNPTKEIENMGLLNKLKRPSDLAVSIVGTEPSLDELEAVVDAGLNSIAQVGLALDTIQTRKLYEPAYQDWPTYLDTRWKLTTDYANRLIQAAAIVAKITAAGLPEPVRTSHTRELAKVRPDAITQVWMEALEESGQDPEAITAQQIASKATKHRKRKARRKAPKAIKLKGRGWTIILQRSTVDVDPLKALDEAVDQMEAQAKAKAA
jgi:hypothetical protein